MPVDFSQNEIQKTLFVEQSNGFILQAPDPDAGYNLSTVIPPFPKTICILNPAIRQAVNCHNFTGFFYLQRWTGKKVRKIRAH